MNQQPHGYSLINDTILSIIVPSAIMYCTTSSGQTVQFGSEQQRIALHLHKTVAYMIVSECVCIVMLRQEMTMHYTEKISQPTINPSIKDLVALYSTLL